MVRLLDAQVKQIIEALGPDAPLSKRVAVRLALQKILERKGG